MLCFGFGFGFGPVVVPHELYHSLSRCVLFAVHWVCLPCMYNVNLYVTLLQFCKATIFLHVHCHVRCVLPKGLLCLSPLFFSRGVGRCVHDVSLHRSSFFFRGYFLTHFLFYLFVVCLLWWWLAATRSAGVCCSHTLTTHSTLTLTLTQHIWLQARTHHSHHTFVWPPDRMLSY